MRCCTYVGCTFFFPNSMAWFFLSIFISIYISISISVSVSAHIAQLEEEAEEMADRVSNSNSLVLRKDRQIATLKQQQLLYYHLSAELQASVQWYVCNNTIIYLCFFWMGVCVCVQRYVCNNTKIFVFWWEDACVCVCVCVCFFFFFAV